MSKNSMPHDASGKRTDVGYKRPPAEHQFKKGERPPPRKKKKQQELSPQELLWRILQEERRVTINGTVQWLRASEIIMKKAFLLAEAGSSTIDRILGELLMRVGNGNERGEGELRIIYDDDPDARTGTETRRRYEL